MITRGWTLRKSRIWPTKDPGLHRCAALNGGGWQNGINYDLTAVCYLLQSVTYKTYRSLYANNDFGKMFDVMDGTTTSFDSTYQCANLPIEKGYYRVLATKKVYLRSSGESTGAPVKAQLW